MPIELSSLLPAMTSLGDGKVSAPLYSYGATMDDRNIIVWHVIVCLNIFTYVCVCIYKTFMKQYIFLLGLLTIYILFYFIL